MKIRVALLSTVFTESDAWKRYFYIESACFRIKHATFLLFLRYFSTFLLESFNFAPQPQFSDRNRVFFD